MRAARVLSLVAVVAGGGGLALHCATGGLDGYAVGWGKDAGGSIEVDGETIFASGNGATSDKLVKCTKQACP